jgi:DNA-binding transcriptional ArsR family regulator
VKRKTDDPRLEKALAHPLRVRILADLERRTSSPRELSDELGEPLGNVSYHVRQLAGLGLVKLVKTTPRRGAVEHHYRASTR